MGTFSSKINHAALILAARYVPSTCLGNSRQEPAPPADTGHAHHDDIRRIEAEEPQSSASEMGLHPEGRLHRPVRLSSTALATDPQDTKTLHPSLRGRPRASGCDTPANSILIAYWHSVGAVSHEGKGSTRPFPQNCSEQIASGNAMLLSFG
jgi:hypothetical protein